MMAICLTEAQRKAYEVDETRLLLSAGAGSGKTRVLVERFVRLVQERKARVDDILLVTFTEKAAKEMKERIRQRFAEEKIKGGRFPFIGTIHSLCAQILSENPLLVPIPLDYQIMDRATHAGLLEGVVLAKMEEIYETDAPFKSLFENYGFQSLLDGIDTCFGKLRSLGLKPEQMKLEEPSLPLALKQKLQEEGLPLPEIALPWETLTEWSQKTFPRGEKEKRTLWEEAMAMAFEFKADPFKKEFQNFLSQIWEAYEKEKQGFIDYDDLQILARHLLKEHPKLRQRYQKRFIMVDEYQDTNPLQVEILDLLRSRKNDFYVGDKKQAIYGFRHAEVSAFNEKEKEFALASEAEVLPLHENFRSRPEVIQFVNHFFSRVWAHDASMYTPLKAMVPSDHKRGVELALVDKGELSLDEAREQEALWVIQRIERLVQEEGYLWRDIVLLVRSTTVLPIYESAFAKSGIPFLLVSGRGFYRQQEIFDVVHLLKALHDPKQDIPLAGFLRSPFVCLSDETLFWCAQQKDILWNVVSRIEAISEISKEEKEKVAQALVLLEQLRGKAPFLNFAQLIEEGIASFGYGSKSLFFPDGKQRLANLQKLLHAVHQYEQGIPDASLLDLIRYLERLEKEETTESEESLEDEDAVRVMTMHKAKGLEFPVVFAVDLGRSEVNQTGDFRISASGELALKILNPITNQKEKPASFLRLHQEQREKELAESKRLFYVVATRAEEKLICVGTANLSEDKKVEEFPHAKSWAKWLQFVFGLRGAEMRLPQGTQFVEIPHQEVRKEGDREVRIKQEDYCEPPKEAKPSHLPELALPFKRVTVTELVKAQASFTSNVSNEFEEDGSLASSLKGSIAHHLLERVDFSRIKEHAVSLLEAHYPCLSQEERQEILRLVEGVNQPFLQECLKNAAAIYREWPFAVVLEDQRIIEGTIDLLIKTHDQKIVIFDYKTGASQKAEAYAFQMELYVWAAQRFFPAASSFESYLLFLQSGECVAVACQDQGNSLVK